MAAEDGGRISSDGRNKDDHVVLEKGSISSLQPKQFMLPV